MGTVLGIMCGGAVGSALRYAVNLGLSDRFGTEFPYGTLVANVTGCLLIGFLGTVLSGAWEVRDEVRLAILVGGLGGFTTFSSFGAETLALVEGGRFVAALSYVTVSNVVGLGAVWFGSRVADWL